MISIVIAAYNAAPFIGICINSCLSLMEAEAEIIVINDGSTDNTLTICNQMASRHSNIFVFSQDNQGVSAARNEGLLRAHNEWVLFMDADDWLNKRDMEFLITNLKQLGEAIDICTFGYNTILQDKIIEHREQDRVCAPIEILNSASFKLASWNYVFRRTLLINNDINFPEGVICTEDQNFNIKALCQARVVQSFNLIVYNYNCTNIYSASHKKHSEAWIKSRLLSANNILSYCILHDVPLLNVYVQVKRLYASYMNDFTTDISVKERASFFISEYNKTVSYLPEIKNIRKFRLCYYNMWLGLLLFKIHKIIVYIKNR